jgi:hypothetical protein
MAYLALNWDQNEALSFFLNNFFSPPIFPLVQKNPFWKKRAVKKYPGPQAGEGISEKSQAGDRLEIYR